METLEYRAGDNNYRAFLIAPAAAARAAGVLVCHGGSGPTDHERDVARRFAEAGYVALVPDLFGEVFTDRARGMAVIGALLSEPDKLRERARASLALLASRPEVDASRLGVLGHCFGGFAALELARSGAEIRAAVSFHGRLATSRPAERGVVRARILACTGAEDPFCPRDHRQQFEDEMSNANVDWQHHILGGARHGFSVPSIDPAKQPGCAHDPRADERSWAAMLSLFAEALAASRSPPPDGG